MFKNGHTINKGRKPWNTGMKGLLLNDLFIKNNPSGPGPKNPNWKGGVATIGNCLDCGIKLKSYPSKYCHPCSFKHRRHQDNSGENHYRWNGGKPKCSDCGEEIEYKAKRCKSCAVLGDRNNHWNGGTSFHNYSILFKNKLKKEIRKRDGFMCFVCNRTENEIGRSLDVHHIDYDKNNCNQDNLISLCTVCHSKTNYNRERWISFFK